MARMSDPGTATIERIGSGAGRVAGAWRTLDRERRLAAMAAIGLFLSLFLPWYQETVIARSGATRLQSASVSLTGWGAFSFFEAMVLLIAAGVLTLLFLRAEGRALPIPDGKVIVAAGGFAALLILWRIFDKQGTSGHGQYATASGIEWGILLALAVAGLLAWAGSRIGAGVTPAPSSPRRESPRPPSNDGPTPAPPRNDGPTPAPARNDDPAATRVSADPAATRVSKRPASLFGPPVQPEDPPTMRLETRVHEPGPDPTVPLDGDA